MSTAAKDVATFIIEPIGSDIYSPDSWTVRERFQGVETTTTYANTGSNGFSVFDDINTEAFKPTTSSSAMHGARIYLKNGLYLLNNNSNNLWWSNDTDADDVKLYMEGETRDGVIIRNASTDTDSTFMASYCTAEIANLTLDGNDLTNVMDSWGTVSNNSGNEKIFGARNVRFMKTDGYAMRSGTASNWTYGYAINCIFEKPKAFEDRCSLHMSKGTLIDGCIFDRSNGAYTGTGQAITGTTADGDTIITNNVIRMPDVGAPAIASESNTDISKVLIANNSINNGRIKIGLTAANSFVMSRIIIRDNILDGDGIEVLGPSTGDHSTQRQYIDIQGNMIYQSYSTAMKLEDLSGPVFVKNNVIVDANRNLSTGNHGGLIWAIDSTDVLIENNVLWMNDKSPADALYSKYGIRYQDLVNCRIMNNIIKNKTTQGQPAYQDGSGNTGTKISRNMW